MPLNHETVSSPLVLFEKHKPEHRRPLDGHLFCGGGCCCCCCCLHSLGGLIGAAAATVKGHSPPGGSVVGFYWSCLACLALLAGAIFSFMSASDGATGGLAFGIIFALSFLPLAQLAASILTFIWVAIVSSDFPDKKASLQTLGSITVWSLAAAVAGFMIMVVGFKMFH